jgi:hypothetical protein
MPALLVLNSKKWRVILKILCPIFDSHLSDFAAGICIQSSKYEGLKLL